MSVKISLKRNNPPIGREPGPSFSQLPLADKICCVIGYGIAGAIMLGIGWLIIAVLFQALWPIAVIVLIGGLMAFPTILYWVCLGWFIFITDRLTTSPQQREAEREQEQERKLLATMRRAQQNQARQTEREGQQLQERNRRIARWGLHHKMTPAEAELCRMGFDGSLSAQEREACCRQYHQIHQALAGQEGIFDLTVTEFNRRYPRDWPPR